MAREINDQMFEQLVAGVQNDYQNANVRWKPPVGEYPGSVLMETAVRQIEDKSTKQQYLAVIPKFQITVGDYTGQEFEEFLSFKTPGSSSMSRQAISEILGSSEGNLREDIARLEEYAGKLSVKVIVSKRPNKQKPGEFFDSYKHELEGVLEDTEVEAEQPEPAPAPAPAVKRGPGRPAKVA